MAISSGTFSDHRRPLALGASLMLALGVLTGPVRPAAAQDPGEALPGKDQPGAPGEDGEIEYLTTTYGITEAQARKHLEYQAWGEEKAAKLAGLSGWAGAWIDHGDGGTVHLQVTDKASLAVVQEDLPDWARADLVTNSLEDLSAVADGAVTRLRAADAPLVQADGASVSTFSVEVSIRDNDVKVETIAGSKAEAAARELYSTDPRVAMLTAQETFVATDAACPNSGCGTYKGGMKLNYTVGSVVKMCTAGFTFRHSGYTYGSTAGHCGNRTFVHGGEDFGDSVDALVINSSSLDYQMIAIHDRDKWKATNTVWRPSDASFEITQQVNTPSSGLEGVTVCHVGVGVIAFLQDNGETCGQITSTDASPGSWSHMGKANFRICGGDSGGPVFTASTRRAYGLTRGYTGGGENCSAASGSESYFTWVNRIEAGSGYQVAVTP